MLWYLVNELIAIKLDQNFSFFYNHLIYIWFCEFYFGITILNVITVNQILNATFIIDNCSWLYFLTKST